MFGATNRATVLVDVRPGEECVIGAHGRCGGRLLRCSTGSRHTPGVDEQTPTQQPTRRHRVCGIRHPHVPLPVAAHVSTPGQRAKPWGLLWAPSSPKKEGTPRGMLRRVRIDCSHIPRGARLPRAHSHQSVASRRRREALGGGRRVVMRHDAVRVAKITCGQPYGRPPLPPAPVRVWFRCGEPHSRSTRGGRTPNTACCGSPYGPGPDSGALL